MAGTSSPSVLPEDSLPPENQFGGPARRKKNILDTIESLEEGRAASERPQ